ncbi:putative monooxygenase [Xylariales sp. AK1849]|nr:putative monooxygenase [Xylariales sp. AK1849]
MAGSKPHVLIVGAGLGGLTLAQALRRKGISFVIFERDESPKARQQGWAIGLHGILNDLMAYMPEDLSPIESSVSHLQPLKLPAQFIIHVAGNRLGVTRDPDTFVLRASRVRLRRWLSSNIFINYGKRATKIEQTKEGVTVHFQDGTSATGDVLVGADGVNSYVREHVLSRPNSQTLRTTPFAVVVGETTLTGADFEHQLSLGHSAYLALSSDKTLSIFVGLSQVSEDGTKGSYYWFFMIPDEDVDNPDHWTKHASPEERREKAWQGADMLEDEFINIVKLTPIEGIRTDAFSFRDAEIEARELTGGRSRCWGTQRTLWHHGCSVRGEGGVHAIHDALALADALSRVTNNGTDSVMELIGAYQEEMTTRGIEAVRRSSNQLRTGRDPNEPWMIWGHPATVTAAESIKLKDWL